jgi:hypothetical protein
MIAALSKKSLLNPFVDAMEPLLGPVGSLLIRGELCLKLCDSIRGRA